MKILIVSDTHGSTRNFDKVIEREKDIDLFLHMGDVEGDEDYMEAMLNCPMHIISGNNDFFSELEREKLIQIGKYKVFMTHGHGYNVYFGTDRLKQAARSRGADIAMYGHTHCPDIDLDDDVMVVNPGSLAYPRQKGRNATYIMMEINDAGEAEFALKYV